MPHTPTNDGQKRFSVPLLSNMFIKRDKAATQDLLKPPQEQRKRTTSSTSGDYVLPGLDTPPDANGDYRSISPRKQDPIYSLPKATASTSRLKMALPGFRRKSADHSSYPMPTSPIGSVSTVSDNLPARNRSAIFNIFSQNPSSQSLPTDVPRHLPPQLPPIDVDRGDFPFQRPPAITTQTLPIPKTPEIRASKTIKVFNWGSKPSKSPSDAPKLSLDGPSTSTEDTLNSFNLKSFRPVRPSSPEKSREVGSNVRHYSEAPTPTSSALRTPRRPQSATESSPKMTVAAFRQAQLDAAKNRSSAHLPVPEHPSDAMPPGNVPLHVSLARPVSPMLRDRSESPNRSQSSTTDVTPPRPSRSVPPATFGRNSPVAPRMYSQPLSQAPSPSVGRNSPVTGTPSRRYSQPLNQAPSPSSRLSGAKWMESDSDSDASSVADGKQGDIRVVRSGEQGNLKRSRIGRGTTMKQRNALSSSFISSRKEGISTSRSDTGHALDRPADLRVSTSFEPSMSMQSMRPGQYSSNSPVVVVTAAKSESGHTTSSRTHSRQESHEQPKYGNVPKSDMGHGRSEPIRSTTPSRSMTLSSTNLRNPSSHAFNTPPTKTTHSAVHVTDTDEDEESSETSEDDDAPLSVLLAPRRPGSSTSHGSGSPSGSSRNLPLRGISPSHSPLKQYPETSGSSPVRSSFAQTPARSSNVASAIQKLESRDRKAPVELQSPSRPPLNRSADVGSAEETPPNSDSKRLLKNLRSFEVTKGHSKLPSESSTPVGVGQRLRSLTGDSEHTPSPFVVRHLNMVPRPLLRDESPGSSFGGSSGKVPLTPRTDSEADTSATNTSISVTTTSSDSSAPAEIAKRKEKRRSVSFDEQPITLGPNGKSIPNHRTDGGNSRPSTAPDAKEVERRERRRSEAQAAVELGRVVNGPPPVVPDEEPSLSTPPLVPSVMNAASSWDPRQQFMQAQQMQNMGMHPQGFNAMGGMPMGFNMMQPGFNPMMGMGMPNGFSMPPVPSMPSVSPGMDPAVMAAHQQAMMMAKQAYQLAVAQQAIAAAGDEWERSSNMGGPRAPSFYGGVPASMYGGSMFGAGFGGSTWGGAASVYGENFGPSPRQQQSGRQSGLLTAGVGFPGVAASEYGGHQSGDSHQRQRTNTAPSSQPAPAYLRGAGAPPLPPPSSWRPS